jgi:hypothetical protein
MGARVHRSKFVTIIAALLTTAYVLASCGGGSARTAAKRTRKSITTTTATTQPPIPTAPETGLPDPGGQSLTRPALWVKVENTPDARPQSGLGVADVVYEQVTEGDITRFVVLFNSQIPDVVGPIRSVRVMDPDVVAPLGGVFAYSGGIQPTVDLINAAPVNAVDETSAGDAMFRDPTKYAPHNLYGHGAQLLGLGGKTVPIVPLFNYVGPGRTFTGDAVVSLIVGFPSGYSVGYDYDAASNTWKRSMEGAPFIDASGQQITPTNVIVEFVGCCLDGYEGARYQTIGSGDAWVFSAGHLVKGTWQRSDRSQPTRFVDIAGQPIPLTPGRTWVEFVPIGTPVDVVSAPAPTTAPAVSTTNSTR